MPLLEVPPLEALLLEAAPLLRPPPLRPSLPDLLPDEGDALLPRDPLSTDAALVRDPVPPESLLVRGPVPLEALLVREAVPLEALLLGDPVSLEALLVRDPLLLDALLVRDPVPLDALLLRDPVPLDAVLPVEPADAAALFPRPTEPAALPADLLPPRPADLDVPLPLDAALARPPLLALVPDLERLEVPRFARPPVEVPPELLLSEPPLNSRRIVSAAALTTAEPIRLAVSAAASALSSASCPAWRAPLRTFWFAVSAAAAVTRPAAIRLRATGLLASSIAF